MTVASFYDDGGLRSELESVPGVHVLSLRKQGRWDVLPFFLRLLSALHVAQPHIVHGYMSGANELVLLAGRLVGARVVWGVRNAMQEGTSGDWLAAGIFRCGAWLSHFSDLIITNSYAGRQFHISHSYAGKRIRVIHNGIDTVRFQPRREAGMMLRQAWGIPAGALLVGNVGRLDPQKGHSILLQAAAQLVGTHASLHFVCVGAGAAAYTQMLQELAEELGLTGRLTWAGTSEAMSAVYSAFDLYVSASCGEGFANAISEAMACGVSCVVTDVGDSALVVGDQGRVVPPDNPTALATALEDLLALSPSERAALGRRARERIEHLFSVPHLASQTEETLREVLSCAH